MLSGASCAGSSSEPKAVAIYGVARTSADVDVTIEVPKPKVPAFVKDMLAAGFVLRVPDVDSFVATTRVLPFESR